MDLREDECYLACKQESSSVAVLLWPRGVKFSIDKEVKERLTQFSREYHVFLRRVSDLPHAIDIVTEIKRSYTIMYLELHGIGTAISLGWPGQILRHGLDRDQLKQLFSLLDPHATIVTLACQNGKGMVDYFADIARGHLIIGHTGDLKHLAIKIRSLKPVVIKCYRYNVDITVSKLL